VVTSVDRPVQVLIGPRDRLLTVAGLAELGVKRVTVGGALAGAATSALIRAARELAEGSLEWTRTGISGGETDALIARGAASPGTALDTYPPVA